MEKKRQQLDEIVRWKEQHKTIHANVRPLSRDEISLIYSSIRRVEYNLKDVIEDLDSLKQDNENYLTKVVEMAELHRVPIFPNKDEPLPLRDLMELLYQYTEENK
jgi:hypothetical protein